MRHRGHQLQSLADAVDHWPARDMLWLCRWCPVAASLPCHGRAMAMPYVLPCCACCRGLDLGLGRGRGHGRGHAVTVAVPWLLRCGAVAVPAVPWPYSTVPPMHSQARCMGVFMPMLCMCAHVCATEVLLAPSPRVERCVAEHGCTARVCTDGLEQRIHPPALFWRDGLHATCSARLCMASLRSVLYPVSTVSLHSVRSQQAVSANSMRSPPNILSAFSVHSAATL